MPGARAQAFRERLERNKQKHRDLAESPAQGIAPKLDATDAAIKLAGEYGIDLFEVKGTGAGGRIIMADVQALLS